MWEKIYFLLIIYIDYIIMVVFLATYSFNANCFFRIQSFAIRLFIVLTQLFNNWRFNRAGIIIFTTFLFLFLLFIFHLAPPQTFNLQNLVRIRHSEWWNQLQILLINQLLNILLLNASLSNTLYIYYDLLSH